MKSSESSITHRTNRNQGVEDSLAVILVTPGDKDNSGVRSVGSGDPGIMSSAGVALVVITGDSGLGVVGLVGKAGGMATLGERTDGGRETTVMSALHIGH